LTSFMVAIYPPILRLKIKLLILLFFSAQDFNQTNEISIWIFFKHRDNFFDFVRSSFQFNENSDCSDLEPIQQNIFDCNLLQKIFLHNLQIDFNF